MKTDVLIFIEGSGRLASIKLYSNYTVNNPGTIILYILRTGASPGCQSAITQCGVGCYPVPLPCVLYVASGRVYSK